MAGETQGRQLPKFIGFTQITARPLVVYTSTKYSANDIALPDNRAEHYLEVPGRAAVHCGSRVPVVQDIVHLLSIECKYLCPKDIEHVCNMAGSRMVARPGLQFIERSSIGSCET